jgi:hypothetical protein
MPTIDYEIQLITLSRYLYQPDRRRGSNDILSVEVNVRIGIGRRVGERQRHYNTQDDDDED